MESTRDTRSTIIPLQPMHLVEVVLDDRVLCGEIGTQSPKDGLRGQ